MNKILIVLLMLFISSIVFAQQKIDTSENIKVKGVCSSSQSYAEKIEIPNYKKRTKDKDSPKSDTLIGTSQRGMLAKTTNFVEDRSKEGYPLGWTTNSETSILKGNTITIDTGNTYIMKLLSKSELNDEIRIDCKCNGSANLEIVYYNDENKVLGKDIITINAQKKQIVKTYSNEYKFNKVLVKIISIKGNIVINEIMY